MRKLDDSGGHSVGPLAVRVQLVRYAIREVAVLILLKRGRDRESEWLLTEGIGDSLLHLSSACMRGIVSSCAAASIR